MQDLELETLLRAMAAGDELIFDVAKRALLLSLRDPEAIVYRQQVLTDCLEHPEVVRELYSLAGEALKAEKGIWGSLLRDSPRQSAGNLGSEDGGVRRLPQTAAGDGRRARREVRLARVHAVLRDAARGARRAVLRADREPSEGAQVQSRDADQRTADGRQQGHGLHAPPAPGAEPARAGVRPLRLQLHDPRSRREWLQGTERARGTRA